jgi:hypothetical protein
VHILFGDACYLEKYNTTHTVFSYFVACASWDKNGHSKLLTYESSVYLNWPFLCITTDCDPILINSILQGWNKYKHVQGQYLRKLSNIKWVGLFTWHAIIRIPDQIWTAIVNTQD